MKPGINIAYLKIGYYLCNCRPHCGSPVKGYAGGSTDIIESVYYTLFLGLLKLRNFHGIVKNVANGR